jgi:sulfite exporter TauE/SafE
MPTDRLPKSFLYSNKVNAARTVGRKDVGVSMSAFSFGTLCSVLGAFASALVRFFGCYLVFVVAVSVSLM